MCTFFDKVKGEEWFMMHITLSATDVRKNWSQFNDDIVREGPRFVRRNRDEWAALSSVHLQAAFEHLAISAQVHQEEDRSFTMSLDEIDIVENADSVEEVLDLMADALIDYAQEYMDSFSLYFNSPNRKHHLPFVLKVIAQPDYETVKSLISYA